ncbi:MAG: hypothetical protein JSU97_02560 [Dehalococcoidia bacterium]|nr:MAG: hypothetical protein JSU97_02560 [Dehalococcoidia bacterium]
MTRKQRRAVCSAVVLAVVVPLLTLGVLHHLAGSAQAQAVDLSIEGVGLGCDTAGGPTTCNVPVSTQFTVRMNVDVLPPGPPGDYKVFQGYLTHTAGLTWVDRPGTAEIVWPDSQLPAEAPGAGYYVAGDVMIFGPPWSTHIGAILEVDYTCGASPSTETVTMVHGFSPSRTFLRDSTDVNHAEAGSESLTINCLGEPPVEVKWMQWPDASPWGLDIGTLEPGLPLVLADDFLCTESGLIKQIDFWASWHWDDPPMGDPSLVAFNVSLHSDVPAGVDLPWSHPGELLWMHTFDVGSCIAEPWAFDVEEGWFDPPAGFYDPFADSQIWLYICPIPEEYWFLQTEGTIYWLDIQAVPIEPVYYWGWKTSVDHWNDSSVWTIGPEPVDPLDWFDLWYPPGHPLYGNPIDLSFQLWGQECDPALDSDFDGFNDYVECYLPTDPWDDCSDTPGVHDAWPLDNNIDRAVTVVGDVLPYSGKIGLPVTNPTLKRLDLDANGSITVVGDVLPFAGNIGATCT